MTRRNSVTVVASIVAIAALSVTGCGGDDHDEATSKQEFVAQADKICQAADKKQAAVSTKFKGIYGEGFSDASYLFRHNAVTRDALERLGTLDAPEEDRKAFDVVLSALAGSVAAIDKQIDALRAKDPPRQSEANREWQQRYGDIVSSTGALGLACQGLGN